MRSLDLLTFEEEALILYKYCMFRLKQTRQSEVGTGVLLNIEQLEIAPKSRAYSHFAFLAFYIFKALVSQTFGSQSNNSGPILFDLN